MVDLLTDSPHHPAMGRRRFLLTSLAGAVSVSFAAEAQPAVGKVPRIGILQPGVRPAAWVEAFGQGLGDLGYVNGQNIVVEHRITYGLVGQRQVIADFVRLKVDVIVTWGMPAVLDAKREGRAIPIVGVVPDPRGIGFTTKLAKLGGNYTELSIQPDERALKTLRLLKEELPTVSRVSLLRDMDSPVSADALRWLQWLQEAAPLLNVAVLVFDDSLLTGLLRRMDLGARNRLPLIYGNSALIIWCGVMSCGVVHPHILHRAAVYVDQILKGGKPADLTVEPPTRLKLAIDLKTATTLGFTPSHCQHWLVPIRRLNVAHHPSTTWE